MTTYATACSGVESFSLAVDGLDFDPLWFSEIEAFPAAVLAHHWPQVPNLGDMMRLRHYIDLGEIEAPDVFCAGTPCQSFSLAGLRGGLSDGRGALTLEFVRVADAIDNARVAAGKPAGVHVWENVPGVLSSKDNAFGCLLAGLAGEDDPLIPPGKKWPNAGCVFGPTRTVAWRILDAQYFGVPQRRRRVFLVASARDGFDPAAVLLEFEGVRRDTSPRHEYRAAGHPSSPAPSAYDMLGFGQYGSGMTSSTVKARDYKDATDLVVMRQVTTTMTSGSNSKASKGAVSGRFFDENIVAKEDAVRRLTPTECERLQGFPDGHTNVPYRNKPAADGPRYKAIGNSKAVPVVRWLAKRIKREIDYGDAAL